MIIQKIWYSKGNNALLVTIPRRCGLVTGDYVKVVRVEDDEST